MVQSFIYNDRMRSNKLLAWILNLVFLTGFLGSAVRAHASPPYSNPAQSSQVTAYDLIAAMNSLRVAYGLPALIEDAIVNAVAQSTAEIMAANQMSWHIGDVRGRIAAAGYGGGATVWATENFAVGNLTIDEIMFIWSDPDHMRPAVTPAYCHVGAGVAQTSDGKSYYVLQAAYVSGASCGASTSSSPSGATRQPGSNPVYGFITPVKIATPDAEGLLYHVVETGQSLWSIAIAYRVTIRDIQTWNNLSNSTVIRAGQRLFIPSSSTKGYATPTQIGMIVLNTPDAEGKIFHTVQPYNNLIKIAEAYSISVDTILALNGLQIDWPLQIGQKLLIFPGNVTPSPTPRPLTPIEKLTPASDGKYYHTVQSGETLSWIAGLYNVALVDLMAWNGLNNTSIIHPEQKLILQVTPPVTLTFTPGPPSATATVTPTIPPPTATQTLTRIALSPTVIATPAAQPSGPAGGWAFLIVLAAAGLILLGLVFRKKPL